MFSHATFCDWEGADVELEYLAENGSISAKLSIVLGQECFLGATWLQQELPKIDALSSVAQTRVAIAV